MIETKDTNYERAKIFWKKGLVVHIVKNSGTFYNGIITEVSSDFFFIEDQKEGNKLVFFRELKKPIETYTKEVEE